MRPDVLAAIEFLLEHGKQTTLTNNCEWPSVEVSTRPSHQPRKQLVNDIQQNAVPKRVMGE